MKKRSKEYRKMMRKHKKIIMRQARCASTDPFDWGVGLELLVRHLYFMKDYYTLGENVWAVEDNTWSKEVKYTRLEMITQILNEYEGWMNCDNKYWGWNDDNEDAYLYTKKPTAEETVVHIKKLKNLVYEDDEQNRKAFNKEYNEHRNKFFSLLTDYIEYLWD